MADKVLTPSLSGEKLKFSFEFYDTSSDQYCISEWPKEKIKKSFGCLKDVSNKSFLTLKREGRVYHFSEVVWEKTTKPNGFPNPQANQMSPFHFALLGVNGQLSRVYGAYASGTFYIVWFDFNHEIWPTSLRNT